MVKNRGRELEDKIVKFLYARPHKNSGAMAEKFDADTENHVLEIKTTQARSYKLDKELWDKLEEDAINHGKAPALILYWDDKKQFYGDNMVVIIGINEFIEISSGN